MRRSFSVGGTSNSKARCYTTPPVNRSISSESSSGDPFKDRLESDKKLLGEFAGYLCGESYQNTDALLDYFKAHVSPDYYDSFIYNNFSPNYLQRIKNKKETVTFTRTQPGQFVKADSRTDEFNVVGIMTRKSDLNSPGELVSSETVAFRVGLRQGPKGRLGLQSR